MKIKIKMKMKIKIKIRIKKTSKKIKNKHEITSKYSKLRMKITATCIYHNFYGQILFL